MADSLIRYGLRFATQPALAFRVDATTEVVTIPTVATTTYWMIGDGTSTDFLEILRQGLETHTSAPTMTATLSEFQVETEITAGGSQHQLVWTNGSTTLDPLLLGYASGADSSSLAVLTSANEAGGLLRPARPRARDSREMTPQLRASAKALSGARRTSHFGEGKSERTLRFELMNEERVLDESRNSSRPYSTWQYAWEQSISHGYAFRLHDDEGDAAYSVYRYDKNDAKEPYARNSRYFVLWDADLPVVAL